MQKKEFESLIQEYTGHLRSLAYHLTMDANNAKDLFQDTMLKIICNEDKFDMSTSFKNWSQAIMKNTLINSYRKNRKHPVNLFDTCDGQAVNSFDSITYNEGLSTLNMEFLLRTINELDEKLRIPFQLYIEGMKYDEMTLALETPVERLRSLVFKAKEQLQAKLKRYRFEAAA